MFSKYFFQVFSDLTARALRASAPAEKRLLLQNTPNIEQVRCAARKGTRARKQAIARANKLKKQNQPQPIPKYLQRKVKVSAELQRTRVTDENWLETQPIDNVYNMKLYRGKPYTFNEAIQMHRDLHQPEMLNNPSALIFASVELDLKLKKKDRFLEDFNGIITYPNEFKGYKSNRIIVICKNAEDQQKGVDAGAVFSGSTTLIKQILSGAVSREDFDYIVCHPDSYKELNVLRGILGKRFPNVNNQFLRLDIDVAVRTFINGIEYNLKRSAIEPDFGWVDVPIGRLDMPTEKLEGNFKYMLNRIESHKPANTNHILFIVRTLLCCQLAREKFKVPHWEYLENYPENGVLLDAEEEVSKQEAA